MGVVYCLVFRVYFLGNATANVKIGRFFLKRSSWY